MDSRGSYVITKQYGLGRIVDQSKDFISVKIPHLKDLFVISITNINISYFFISEEVIKKIIDIRSAIPFSSEIKTRAYAYATPNKLDNFRYFKDQAILEAAILGTYTYTVEIDLNRKEVTCTCPYQDYCKHEYALLSYIINQYDVLSKVEIEQPKPKEIVVKPIVEDILPSSPLVDENMKIEARVLTNPFDFKVFVNMYSQLLSYNDASTEAFIYRLLNSSLGKTNICALVDLICIKNNGSIAFVSKTINKMKLGKNFSIIRRELDLISRYSGTTKYYDVYCHPYTFLSYFFRGSRKEAFKSISSEMLNDVDFYKKNISSIVDYAANDPKCYAGLIYLYDISKFMKSLSYSLERLIPSLYEKLTEEEKTEVIDLIPYDLMNINDFSSFILNIFFDENCAKKITFLANKFSSLTEKEKTLLEERILSLLSSSRRIISSTKEAIIALFSLYPNNLYLDEMINEFPYYSYDYDEDLDDLEDSRYQPDIDNIAYSTYFAGDLKLSIDGDDLIYTYSLLLKNSQETLFSVSFIGKKIDRFNNQPFSVTVIPLMYQVIKDCKEDPKYIETIKDYQKQIAILKQDKEDKMILGLFESASNEVAKEEVKTFSSFSYVKLEYHFTYLCDDDYEREPSMALGLKVGNNKMYSVSSIRNFISHFKYKEEHTYGTSLSFVHDISNVAQEDKEPLQALLTQYYNTYNMNSQKQVVLNSYFFSSFINLLKGRFIYLDEKLYKVTLEEVELKVKLDDKYNLYLEKNDDLDLIYIGKQGYLINNANKTLDLLTSDSTKSKLIRILNDNNDLDISRIKKQFVEKIYSTFSSDIEVDEKISNEFKVSSLVIETYFDMNEDGDIKKRTKLFKGEVEIGEKSIDSSFDKAKYNKYQILLENMGFVGDIIEKDDDILTFLSMDMTPFKRVSKVFLSEGLVNKQVAKFLPPKIKMDYSNNLLNVFVGESKYSDDDLSRVLSAIKKKKKFVLLKNNQILTIDNKESKEFDEIVNQLALDKKNLSKAESKPIYQSLYAFNNINHFELDNHLDKMIKEITSFKESSFELPKIEGTLKPYQIEGYKWLKSLTKYHLGGVLADDMGLGKTLEMITLLKSDDLNKPSIIVTPKSLAFNWLSEFDKFDPSAEVKLIFGLSDSRKEAILSIKKDKKVIYITSFDSLRNDIKLYEGIEFNYIILDEAQYIKNIHALKTQNVKKLKGLQHFALTGTPIENDIFDLWSIFDFLMPHYLPRIEQFKSYAGDEDYQKQVAKQVALFILRRTKKEVLKDLPPKYEHIITCEMEVEQRKLYDAICLEAKEKLNREGSKPMDVLYLLTRLRQVCVDPNTFLENYSGSSCKTDLMMNIVNDYIKEDHRILIFSQFVKGLNILEERLKSDGIKYLILTGDTGASKRLEYVNLFNKDKYIKVYLISLKAGGNGLNLVGADTVIHFDPWWNLSAENQATDRAYRIGQTKNVEVIRLIVEQSIEQRVVELQNKKKDLIDRIISNDDTSITKVTLDDLKFILG